MLTQKEKFHKHYMDHREYYNNLAKDYYQKHKEDIKKKWAIYRNKNKEKVCKHRREYQKERYDKIKLEIFHLLGDKCTICGFSDKRILQIDHIHGGGTKEADSFKGNRYAYLCMVIQKIKSGSKDYQLLCPNHNWLKRIENKEEGVHS